MAANSRYIPEKRMHWLSRSTTIHGDSFNNSTISEDSGRGMSGRFDIRQRIAHLYRKQLYTDVMFVIQCGIEPKPVFYAHKAILAAGSKHFAEMLFGSEDNLPKTTEPVKKLQINNVSPEAFRNVIEFLYTDDMYFDNEPLVIETLLTAKKFEIQPLIDRCESHLEEIELCNSTVCSLLQIATEHKIDALKNRCLSFIQENTGDVIKAEDFMKSPLSTVRTICKLQSLNLASEIELITAAFKWAEHQNTSSKRAAVEPVLRCLRFLVLEAKDFSNLLNQYPDIFTSHEALQIMMYLSNPGKGIDKLPSWCNKGTNRCSYVKPPVPSVSPVDTKIPPGQKKLEIALKPFSPQNFLSSLNCNLEIRCNCGRFQLIGLTLLFQEPIMKRSHIDTLTITVVVKPTNFRYKEILKITDSKEVQFTFQKGILFSQGQVASIQAAAENAEFYYFLQFDEKHLPQVDPRFTCSLGSSAKESKLFFIYEVFYVELPFRRPPSRRSNR